MGKVERHAILSCIEVEKMVLKFIENFFILLLFLNLPDGNELLGVGCARVVVTIYLLMSIYLLSIYLLCLQWAFFYMAYF